VGAIGDARVTVPLSRIRFCPHHATMVYTRGRAKVSNPDGVRRYRFTIPASGGRAKRSRLARPFGAGTIGRRPG
jgi:hypothetical protein